MTVNAPYFAQSPWAIWSAISWQDQTSFKHWEALYHVFLFFLPLINYHRNKVISLVFVECHTTKALHFQDFKNPQCLGNHGPRKEDGSRQQQVSSRHLLDIRLATPNPRVAAVVAFLGDVDESSHHPWHLSCCWLLAHGAQLEQLHKTWEKNEVFCFLLGANLLWRTR